MFVLLYEAVQIFTSIVLYPGLEALRTQLGSNLASLLKAHESCQQSRPSPVVFVLITAHTSQHSAYTTLTPAH